MAKYFPRAFDTPVHEANIEPWGYYKPSGLYALCIVIARRSFLFRSILRKIVKRILPRGAIFDIRVNSLKMRCHLNDNSTETNFIFHGVRKEKSGLRRIINPLFPGSTFIDIGANCGLYSLMASRRVGHSGRVIAIEPNPEMVERLWFNLNANNLTNTSIIPLAVSDKFGFAILHIDNRQKGKSSLSPIDGCEPVSVGTAPLFQIISEAKLSKIDAMKIDVEGHEDRVLLPFFETAPRHLWPRKIFIETHCKPRWSKDCVQGLIDRGYKISWQNTKDALMELEGRLEHGGAE